MSKLHELDAYLTGEHEDAGAFEEAMFDAPDDPDLHFFDRVTRHGARLAAHGTFDMGCLPELIDGLIAKGHRVQLEERWPGKCRIDIADDTEILATKLHIGRTDLERVDVEISVPRLGVAKTIRDALVDQRDGTACGMCERSLAVLAYTAGAAHVRIRERGGERRVIAEYLFNEHLG